MSYNGKANLKAFKPDAASSEEEAKRHRELSSKGGKASGESRRRAISMREELRALLAVDDGAIAKGITVAICREARNGSVPAYRAILETLGEMTQIVEMNEHVSPITLKLPTQEQLAEIARRREERNAKDERELGTGG